MDEKIIKDITPKIYQEWEELSYSTISWESLLPDTRRLYFNCVRAAIAAYEEALAEREWGIKPREPTDEMLIGARDWSIQRYGRGVGNDDATGCWHAMYDAAPEWEG